MRSTSPLPAVGEVFLDSRGDHRALRVTWHADAGMVVLSLWHDRTCVGTFRLPLEDVPALVRVLRGVLERAYDEARGAFLPGFDPVTDEEAG